LSHPGLDVHDVVAAAASELDDVRAAVERTVATNVLEPALLINLAVPHLRETRGRIVLVGSVAGTIYTEDNLYGAFKWAVHALAENPGSLSPATASASRWSRPAGRSPTSGPRRSPRVRW